MTDIQFSLARESHVSLTVFNVLGQTVRVLHDGRLTAGSHTISWDGTDAHGRAAASGIYLYRITADQTDIVKKMLLLK
jgi:flagellar hook assembly protein FlgD